MIFFDSLLLPILIIADPGGPINLTPLLLHSSANPAFSDRNPKPGWRASHWDYWAIYKILEEFK